ncbi:helix-turn-helix domain-containing protein [Nonomuraea cypriaca]|uniref:helix-turn-helix domain-containing protein n=1 Tax=Nonomuraea cypriaca TaxID=1187855 RepID=UPI001F3C0A6B|nr:helix-turn-helix domain-containing protein [Nonomuraea cypriaca]
MSDTWTIGELADRAARTLRDGATPLNGRVRDVPGDRLIRWYTTIGLVDPPLTRRGRIARYGRRHLLQLVAVKRMQAAGHSIAQIQVALAGATDTMLEAAAGAFNDAPMTDAPLEGHSPTGTSLTDPPLTGRPLDGPRPGDPRPGDRRSGNPALCDPQPGDPAFAGPALDDPRQVVTPSLDGHPEPDAEPPRNAAGRPGSRHGRVRTAEPGGAAPGDESGLGRGPARGRFWAEHPGRGRARNPESPGDAVTPGGPIETPGQKKSSGHPTEARATDRGALPGMIAGVVLDDGVRLVLDAGRVLSRDDVEALRAAAGPLLAVLEERELL